MQKYWGKLPHFVLTAKNFDILCPARPAGKNDFPEIRLLQKPVGDADKKR